MEITGVIRRNTKRDRDLDTTVDDDGWAERVVQAL